MAAMKRAISWTATILMVAVLLAFVAVAGLILAGYRPETIISGSMSPRLERGYLVFAKATPASQLRVGQIITFQNPNKPKGHTVTHRINKIVQTPTGPIFRTKGDANPYLDPWNLRIQKDAGLFAFAIPYVGSLSFLVGSEVGYALLLAIPILILMIFGLIKLWSSPASKDGEAEPKTAPPPSSEELFGYPREV